MKVESRKLFIGFITYGESSFKYLPFFLDSLKNQSFKDFSIIAFDNSEDDNSNSDYLIDNFPEIKLVKSEKNIGYAQAYNKMIEVALASKADYFFALNPDIILENNTIERMIENIEKNEKLGSITPKIFQWDFKNKKKTDIIDTCGIKLEKGFRFIDIGQGRKSVDNDELKKILGPSGAAAMYRMSALEKVAVDGKYFDENMFMYKEDCDLAYRLFLAGYRSECLDGAIVYHDRTALSLGSDLKVFKTRAGKNRKGKEWSFLNQHIIFLKYWRKQSLVNKFFILVYAFKMFVYILIFERFLFKKYFELFSLRKNINYY